MKKSSNIQEKNYIKDLIYNDLLNSQIGDNKMRELFYTQYKHVDNTITNQLKIDW